jgi:intracellular septation protein A
MLIESEPEFEHVTLPSLPLLARRAVPQVIEGAVMPAVLFVVTKSFAGLAPAILAALSWSVAVITFRLATGRRVPGIVVFAAVTLLVRSALGILTDSAFVYFFQPSLGAFSLASAFLVSVTLKRPLAKRFVGDFCALPSHLLHDDRLHRFFCHLSLMWAFVGFANAGLTFWLLVTQPTAVFVVTRMALSVGATVLAVGVSFVWFRQMIAREGLAVRLV